MMVGISKTTLKVPFDLGDEIFVLVHPFSSLAEVRKIRITKITFFASGFAVVGGKDEAGREVEVRDQFCFIDREEAEKKKEELALK